MHHFTVVSWSRSKDLLPRGQHLVDPVQRHSIYYRDGSVSIVNRHNTRARQPRVHMWTVIVDIPVVDLRGAGGPNSFIFMQFYHIHFGSWGTPQEKSWIRHCIRPFTLDWGGGESIIFGGHKSYFCYHWYDFRILGISALGFKVRAGPFTCLLHHWCMMNSSDSSLNASPAHFLVAWCEPIPFPTYIFKQR